MSNKKGNPCPMDKAEEEKLKYDPASVVVPPFERLPEGSCPNVHKIIE